MKNQIPESYQPGVSYLESLNVAALREWLHAELHEKVHVLAGQPDDYPVQAIVNHYPYLTIEAQKRFADAVESLILEWRRTPADWTEAAARSLLNIAAELRLVPAKLKLQALVNTPSEMARISPTLHPAIFRALAALASNEDRTFWLNLPLAEPNLGGMAFQVIAKIAPDDAFTLLACLPPVDDAVGGVCRNIGIFVSQFPTEKRDSVLRKVLSSTDRFSPQQKEQLERALSDAGFDLPLRAIEESWIFTNLKITLKKVGLQATPSSLTLGGGTNLQGQILSNGRGLCRRA